jgi:agmatinase
MTKSEQLRAILEPVENDVPPREDAGIFGITVPTDLAKLAIIGVPWDVTTSYGHGTARTPEAIVRPSHQLDLFDINFGKPYRHGIALEVLPGVEDLNKKGRKIVDQARDGDEKAVSQINDMSQTVNNDVYKRSKELLDQGKMVGLLGGDHSCPLGLIKALNERYKDITVIHIDAHHDLRDGYEGFTYSHASIMNNVLRECPNVTKLIALGIRDFSQDEWDMAHGSKGRVSTLYAADFFEKRNEGQAVSAIFDEVLAQASSHIYISFDIDGLDPVNCPGTGTPVPGGFAFSDISYLLNKIAKSAKQVVGWDLCEVSESEGGAGEWDLNVGARVLYKLCGLSLLNER